MLLSHKQLVWALAAYAAVVAQVTPQSRCHACDQPCCAAGASGHGPKTADSGIAPADSCPLCATKVDLGHPEAGERPCHCQLTARQEQPLSVSRGTLPAFADDAPSIGLAVIPPLVPQALGVSREYLAASLAVPIRPLRILFGVWRN